MSTISRAPEARRLRTRLRLASALVLAFATSACTGFPTNVRRQVVAPGELPIQLGTPARTNLTPLEASLACFAGDLASTRRPPIVVGVGEIKDYTGRYSINEGNVVTQGGSLMLFSALGKMGGTVRIAERYDPSVAERELAYMDRRQLGNGKTHEANGQRVPWLPYFGGTVQASDYYIVGGITEVNYNIASGGAEVAINNIGFKGRTYSQSIAIDLRIVDSRSLIVVDAISLSKQFVGYEVGANTFRFFGIGLVNVNLGEKGQEPLQLGIRATIEEGAIRLIGRATGVDPAKCLALRTQGIATRSAEHIFLDNLARTPLPASATAPASSPAPGFSLLGPQAPISPEAQRNAPSVPPRPAMAAASSPVVRPTTATGPQRGTANPEVPAATAKRPSGTTPPGGPTAPVKPAAAKPPAPATQVSAKPIQGSAVKLVQGPASTFAITFELGASNLAAGAQPILDRVTAAIRLGSVVNLTLLSPDSEKLEPSQRNRVLDQRLSSLAVALAARGIPAGLVLITWRPSIADSTIYREGSGQQLIARLRISK